MISIIKCIMLRICPKISRAYRQFGHQTVSSRDFFCVQYIACCFQTMFNKVHPQLLGVLDGSNSFEGHLRLLGGVECRGKHIVKNSPISQCSLAKTESTKGAGAKGNTVYTQCHNAFLQKSPLSILVQTNFIVMSTIAIHSNLFCVTSIPLKLLQRNIEDQQTHG